MLIKAGKVKLAVYYGLYLSSLPSNHVIQKRQWNIYENWEKLKNRCWTGFSSLRALPDFLNCIVGRKLRY